MSEVRDVCSRELQMAAPTGVYGWVHRGIVEPQAQHAAHAAEGLLCRLHRAAMLGRLQDFLRKDRQDLHGFRCIEIVQHSVQEGLPPRTRVQRR